MHMQIKQDFGWADTHTSTQTHTHTCVLLKLLFLQQLNIQTIENNKKQKSILLASVGYLKYLTNFWLGCRKIVKKFEKFLNTTNFLP